MRSKKLVSYTLLGAVFTSLSLVSSSAFAVKLTEMFVPNVTGEMGAGLTAFLFVMGIIGVIFFTLSGLEYNKQRKSGSQADYSKMWGMIVTGLFLGIAVPLYTASIASTTGEEVEVQTQYSGGF